MHIGSCFFGESMFNHMTNTSKLTLLYLISLLVNNKFALLDSQFYNSHLLQFGAYEISDHKYQQYLYKGINKKTPFPQELNFQKISINFAVFKPKIINRMFQRSCCRTRGNHPTLINKL